MEKSTWNRICLALAIPPLALLVLFTCILKFAPRVPANPQWDTLSVARVDSVLLAPRLSYQSYRTISKSIAVTNPEVIAEWFEAVDEAKPLEGWPGTAVNRDRGPRRLALSFNSSNKVVTFEVWMCDKNQLSSCKEDLVTTDYVETRYSKELRTLIDKILSSHPDITWVADHKRQWSNDGTRYIGRRKK